jgi:hypothetical protein
MMVRYETFAHGKWRKWILTERLFLKCKEDGVNEFDVFYVIVDDVV